MQPRLTLAGPVNSYTGYGMLTIQIARSLQKLTGAYVALRSLSTSEAFGAVIPPDIKDILVHGVQPEPFEILHHPPNYEPIAGKQTVWASMWESCRLRPRQVELLNRAVAVLTPSAWGQACMSASGVNVPIHKWPLGINLDVFRYRAVEPHTRPTFVFGAAGRTAHGGVRKGIDDVIEGFLRAFPAEKDVELRIKVFPDCVVPAVKDPRIKYLRAYISDSEMSDWMTGIDCFVSAARGEGWSLLPHQAMATGVPVIACAFSGITEFFNETVGYPIEYSLAPATDHYEGCGHWAMPKIKSIVERMRQVYENRWDAHLMGAKASISVQHLTHDFSMTHVVTVLKEVGAL